MDKWEKVDMKINKNKILHKTVKYSRTFTHYDDFSIADEKNKFEYTIVISKCYTLAGVVWEIEMPNCTDYDKNLYSLIVRSIEYAANKFPQYFRLVDELYNKGLTNKLWK